MIFIWLFYFSASHLFSPIERGKREREAKEKTIVGIVIGGKQWENLVAISYGRKSLDIASSR